ncbi:CPXCG motif-containing cysteine-rich protein [Nitrospira defluvii]|nr:CPXCG motif-containing cysteine-rich protein [Nitrospira defluvii]
MNCLEQVEVGCPYCGEVIELLVDCSLEIQSYIEDCEVCCRPITVNVVLEESGLPCVTVFSDDGA